MSNNTQMEDLLTALATLTEHNQQILDQLERQGQANSEQYAQQVQLTNSIMAHFEQLQNKERLLTEKTIASIQQGIDEAFAKNKESYHEKINQAFTDHVDHASLALQKQVEVCKRHNHDLTEHIKLADMTFRDYVTAIAFNEATYRTESEKLKAKVGNTLKEVSDTSREQLEGLTDELSKKLSTKFAIVLGSVCFFVLLATLFMAWLLIPSKAEIAKRQAIHDELSHAQVLDNIQKADDGYYAEVDTSNCYTVENSFKVKTLDRKFCKFK